jgi:hypothetical protein
VVVRRVVNFTALPVRNMVSCIRHPYIRVKPSAYGYSVATLLNPRGVATVSHKSARLVAVVVAVPSTVHCPDNYKIKIYII